MVDSPMLERTPAITPPSGWRLGRLLATGGTARVFSVHRDGLPPAVMKWGRWREHVIRARFEVEAGVLRSLGPPATPGFVEHGEVDDWPFLIMEHVPGETLAAWMARSGDRGGTTEILAILIRLASALDAIHLSGFVHRDLKPENVLIGAQGVRVIDLGLAKPLHMSPLGLTPIGRVVGTLHYLAPEQLRGGGNVDRRADIYSFGVIAFEMFAGRPPFTGERRAIEYKHLVCQPPSVCESRDIPQEIDELVRACLAKRAESRPNSAAEVGARLASMLEGFGTLRGIGVTRADKPLGARDQVVLAWIEGGDPVAVARAIAEAQGLVVHRRGDGILAAFASLHHEAPMGVALNTSRALARDGCRIVAHVTTALVRRSAHGKPAVYGQDLDHVDRWIPRAPFLGLVLTTAAAELVGNTVEPDPILPRFFRERQRAAHTLHDAPVLVGRDGVIRDIVTAATSERSLLLGITGPAGVGKTRVLQAVVEQLRAAGREVVALRGRRRFPGGQPDDDRLIEALGGGHDLADAAAHAGARGAVVAIDDMQWLSMPARRVVLASDLSLVRLIASSTPLFEVDAATDAIAIELPPLSAPDANTLLGELLRARRLPDALVERLALRAMGNPGLLVALANVVKRGGDGSAVADDRDAALATVSARFAERAIEELPVELGPIVRGCSGLGPRFRADEVASALGLPDAESGLAALAHRGVLCERGGWYEFTDPRLQDAVYDGDELDHRVAVHANALAYWIARRSVNVVDWLARVAYHAAGAGDRVIATTCWIALARVARDRGESELANELLARSLGCLGGGVPASIVEAIQLLGQP